MTKARQYNLILIFLCLVFFLVYSYTIWLVWLPNWLEFKHLIFNWPDANANYFFAQLFAQQGSFTFFEPLNQIAGNILHTRSINVLQASLVPMTFLPSLVIFGFFIKLLGSLGVLFLTPSLASLTVYFIYRLSLNIFKDLDLSFIIALLLGTLAPWLYFSNVVMLPNILFIFLLVTGWLCLANYIKKIKNIYWLLSNLFLGLAILVRPTEIVWVSLLILFVWYLNRRYLKYQQLISGLFIFLTLGYLFLYLNKITYGSYFSLGYFNFNEGFNELGQTNSSSNTLRLLIAPFGFNLILILKNFYQYFFNIIIVQFILALASLILLFSRRKMDKVWKNYLIFTPIIFLLILLYYGSWQLADPLVLELNRISISYVRYFLPLYLWILPLTAWGLIRIFKKKLRVISYILILLMIVISIRISFYSPNDGLIQNKTVLENYYTQFIKVKQIAVPGSVIISERSDKVFFPYYRVIMPQGDLELWSRVVNLIDQVDVYYYTNQENIIIDQDLANQVNLEIVQPREIWSNFRLYQVINK